jgi:hypothetical protein
MATIFPDLDLNVAASVATRTMAAAVLWTPVANPVTSANVTCDRVRMQEPRPDADELLGLWARRDWMTRMGIPDEDIREACDPKRFPVDVSEELRQRKAVLARRREPTNEELCAWADAYTPPPEIIDD